MPIDYGQRLVPAFKKMRIVSLIALPTLRDWNCLSSFTADQDVESEFLQREMPLLKMPEVSLLKKLFNLIPNRF